MAQEVAEHFGFKRTNNFSFNSHKQAVFVKGNKFITLDKDSHKGGFWKVFDNKNKRIGTFNYNLTKKIGT